MTFDTIILEKKTSPIINTFLQHILICIHGIIVNSDLMYQHLCETEHLYYLFGSSSKRIMPLCHLVDDMQVLTLNHKGDEVPIRDMVPEGYLFKHILRVAKNQG